MDNKKKKIRLRLKHKQAHEHLTRSASRRQIRRPVSYHQLCDVFKRSLCVICMHTHVHTLCVVCAVQVYTCAHKHACVGQRLRLGIFLNYSRPYLGGQICCWSQSSPIGAWVASKPQESSWHHLILSFPALEFQALDTVLDFGRGHWASTLKPSRLCRKHLTDWVAHLLSCSKELCVCVYPCVYTCVYRCMWPYLCM